MDHELFTASLYREVRFSFSRSGGPGGQNVNKVSTRVTASVAVGALDGLTEEEAALIKTRLASRISAEGFISVSVQDTRSQLRNRELALQRLEALLRAGRHSRAQRRPTRPTASSLRRRQENKKRVSQKKAGRLKPGTEE
ncbi:MAG: aminoacyl-tRNA hydrolase [Spirochaetaceae bacterium]|nr:aminoacyl-tRNA hydrolase [Spirochaetaceae bacterium]